SAGFMHAGYPIMAHMRSAGRSVDLEQLEKQGSWGHFHELGHNAQQRAWTFAGTVEVTCNLFSLHAMEKIVGIAGHGGVAKARARAAAYLARGGDFERWKREPFLALEMYRQLIEAFGWDSFTRVFREYDALPKGERPRSDREKRDQWCLRFSKQVGRDLSPFFARWAVPLSPSVQEELAELEDWSGK
ncbi:MAG: M60 family metallopeptidase, partial [Planctomycetota bacterium]